MIQELPSYESVEAVHTYIVPLPVMDAKRGICVSIHSKMKPAAVAVGRSRFNYFVTVTLSLSLTEVKT